MKIIAWVCLASAVAAALLALVGWRRNRSFSGWMFVGALIALAAERALALESLNATTLGRVEFWQQWRLLALTLLGAAGLLFALTYARGNASAFLSRWRYIIAGLLLPPPVLALVLHDRLFVSLRADATYGWILGLGWPGILLHAFVATTAVFTVMNFERTFRASVGIMRWRIKFVLLGLGVLFVVLIYTSSQALLYRSIDERTEAVNAIATLVALLVLVRGVFRPHSAETDVYPSLSVLQGSITVLVAGVYLLIVGALAKVTTYLGGDTAFALKAFLVLLSLVLLAVALQSDRARLALRRFVSRHFQRPAYDYRSTWMAFTEGTSACVEQADLCRSIVQLAAKLFDALSVGLWLVDERSDRLVLAASTATTHSPAETAAWAPATLPALRDYFAQHPGATDLDLSHAPWAASLRRVQPREFLHGGNRVCVPLLRRGDVIGLIIAGDRVGGVEFTPQDFDMLKCIAGHATAGLLNVQLSQRLMQAKELEAFQAMAAFLIHDLKNATSSLNLMLQNLPLNFTDPLFREDALRGLGKTVTHINGLIGRLSSLRHQLQIRPVPADLNSVVSAALAALEHPAAATVVKKLTPLPSAPLDPDQLQKVVTNLVLNAIESVSPGGEVQVSTAEENGWLVLSVSDNGCGMSRDFLQHSLFRPFQTTKRNGLGIGMFHSRTIVEAHGGRITAASEPGHGTTFRVLLPKTSKS